MSDEMICMCPPTDPDTLRQMSPVTLAFIGDAVFGLLVREHLIASGITKAGSLHRQAVTFVRASAQAESVERLQSCLTPEELNIIRRGRNANTTHVPKNANPIDYRIATGLEALFGYLYLAGSHARLREIFRALIENPASETQ